jgi:hypothetical protein
MAPFGRCMLLALCLVLCVALAANSAFGQCGSPSVSGANAAAAAQLSQPLVQPQFSFPQPAAIPAPQLFAAPSNVNIVSAFQPTGSSASSSASTAVAGSPATVFGFPQLAVVPQSSLLAFSQPVTALQVSACGPGGCNGGRQGILSRLGNRKVARSRSVSVSR